MAEPAAALEKVLRKAGLGAAAIAPIYFNVTGAPEADPDKGLTLMVFTGKRAFGRQAVSDRETG